jgi:hypothetical protein
VVVHDDGQRLQPQVLEGARRRKLLRQHPINLGQSLVEPLEREPPVVKACPWDCRESRRRVPGKRNRIRRFGPGPAKRLLTLVCDRSSDSVLPKKPGNSSR